MGILVSDCTNHSGLDGRFIRIGIKNALQTNFDEKIKNFRQFLRESVQILEGASPKTILARGYSMVKTADGKIVRSQTDVKNGEKIEVYPAEGKILATVD